MTINSILKDMKLCYGADYGTAGWRHPLHSMISDYVHIRDTKTKEIFVLNVHGYYHGYKDYEYKPDAKRYLSGDYEYFDPIRVYGVGYLIPEQGVPVKETITTMYDALCAYHHANDKDKCFFCGGSTWVDGYTNAFSFYYDNTAQIDVMSVKEFAYLNNNRRLLGAQSIPYNSQVPDNAVVIMLINDMDRLKAFPEETDPAKAWSFIDSFFGEELTVIKMDIKKDYGHRAN